MARRRPILLTVDDTSAFHDLYALAFQRDYTHLRAHGGNEALDIVRSRPVDVMVLDLVMPDLDGFEVLERALKLAPALIVVIASVIDAAPEALRAIRGGAADYFVKPTEPDVMEMVLRQHLAARDDPAVAIPQPALVARRVLVVGPDPGFRAALTVALQPRCRVDGAGRISVAAEMLDVMRPDLVVVDLRSRSAEHTLGLDCLRARAPEAAMMIVGSTPRTDSPAILVLEPVDFAMMFDQIAALLARGPGGPPLKPLGAASSAAVGRVVRDYADPALRAAHLAAAGGLSAGHFAHVFSEEMGIPPMEYVLRVRTQAAISMLRETRDKVSAIAHRFGFYDGAHLAMAFRRRRLGRPSDFRPA